jgi:hypothetical protein
MREPRKPERALAAIGASLAPAGAITVLDRPVSEIGRLGGAGADALFLEV